ncbi:hypothetical protein [Psychrobacillus sp. OK032]|uniref:hypothetical protein n=1 Tax=Psychrobacillus sp. OK032 TaxID=1884358 RepID=UPI000B88801F|nr:hypothetical protein [Psychrobacillus sp. OK032]
MIHHIALSVVNYTALNILSLVIWTLYPFNYIDTLGLYPSQRFSNHKMDDVTDEFNLEDSDAEAKKKK